MLKKTGYNTTYIAYFVKNKIRQHSQTVIKHNLHSRSRKEKDLLYKPTSLFRSTF